MDDKLNFWIYWDRTQRKVRNKIGTMELIAMMKDVRGAYQYINIMKRYIHRSDNLVLFNNITKEKKLYHYKEL